jgi:hypothetical protein
MRKTYFGLKAEKKHVIGMLALLFWEQKSVSCKMVRKGSWQKKDKMGEGNEWIEKDGHRID